MSSHAEVTPAEPAAAAAGVSRRLRQLADLLDNGNGSQLAHVAECLQSLAQQLVAPCSAPQPAVPALAGETVESLERSYAAPPAAKSAAIAAEPTDDAQPKTKKQRRADKSFDYSKYSTRFVVLHIMYVGWSYQGLARQENTDNTIEGVLFPALRRVKLIPEDVEIASLAYSRCGRTDKGVSALGQVLALKLRSSALAGQQLPPVTQELDYPIIINRALPDTIRVLGWADVTPDFNARFSCLDREYKYFIVQDGSLDLAAMQEAAQHLVGEHDFRHFCKADVAQVKNFIREVLSATIEPVHSSCPGMTVVALHIKGTAFLWHQVRCIAAVLLMVGRGQEQPSIVQRLLDIAATPCKPQYSLAAEEPLLLFSCGYEGLTWQLSEVNFSRCMAVVGEQLQQHLVAAALTSAVYEQLQEQRAKLLQVQQKPLSQQELLSSMQACHTAARTAADGQQQQQQTGSSNALVAGFSRWMMRKAPHMKLLKRATEPSIEERFMKAGISLDLLNQKGRGLEDLG